MISRFNGSEGNIALKEAVLEQRVVRHDEAVADKLIAAGKVILHQPDEEIIQQGDAGTQVYFILAGEVAIEVNTRVVAPRYAREMVGEMAAIDPAAPRSATVRATAETVTLRVEASKFLGIANEHPIVWQMVARVLGERLRQRHQFHRLPNPHPVLFIGSSAEGLPVAQDIQLGLKHSKIKVQLWSTGVFGPSSVPLEALLKKIDECDFAAFVFGPDDCVVSRGKDSEAPRDNVIFELGMFIARLGRERSYIVKEHATDLKIPSDLTGLSPITYVAPPDTELEIVLGTVCTELEKQVMRLGPI